MPDNKVPPTYIYGKIHKKFQTYSMLAPKSNCFNLFFFSVYIELHKKTANHIKLKRWIVPKRLSIHET